MSNTTLCAKLRLSCKCIEWILAVICIGLYVNAPIYPKGGGVLPTGTLMTLTFGGYVIILLGVILGYLCGEKVPKKTDLLYTLVGLCLFVASGSVGINFYNHHHGVHGGHTTTASTLEHGSQGSQHGIHGSPHGSNDTFMGGLMTYERIGLACSAIAIINGGVFLMDAMLSYKDVSENYTPH